MCDGRACVMVEHVWWSRQRTASWPKHAHVLLVLHDSAVALMKVLRLNGKLIACMGAIGGNGYARWADLPSARIWAVMVAVPQLSFHFQTTHDCGAHFVTIAAFWGCVFLQVTFLFVYYQAYVLFHYQVCFLKLHWMHHRDYIHDARVLSSLFALLLF